MSRLIDAAELAGLMVAMDPIPQTIEYLIHAAQERHPGLDWEVAGVCDWKAQLRSVRDDLMARALRSMRPRAHIDHIAFANMVLPLLRGQFAVEREDK